MKKHQYALGVDFGTLSARAVLVEIRTGRVAGTAVSPYQHGVIDQHLPGGPPLPPDWALQYPSDYIEGLTQSVRGVLRKTRVPPASLVGIGTDFTACTMLPTDRAGTPLCELPKWKRHPHAWVKLWKHHGAQPEADRLSALARTRKEPFLKQYGGAISSEWMIPKIWETLNDDPAVYRAADRFVEAGDWITWQMTGRESRNACAAGYKGMWHKKRGAPSRKFFRGLDPRLERVEEKFSSVVSPMGARAGTLTAAMALRLGLPVGLPVAVGTIDAHAAVPACGVSGPGTLVMIMGTSLCHLWVDRKEHFVEGVAGVVEDGILPGYFGYEAGQAAVGDLFGWYADHVRQSHGSLTKAASRYRPGETGLLALDWWNGNRSVLMNANLSGVLMGMTLSTSPAAVYRALLESTAFGTLMIVETIERAGMRINTLAACGGLPESNPLLMQIFADVTGRPIRVVKHPGLSSAIGAAMWGAVASGTVTLPQAVKQMAGGVIKIYRPSPAAHKTYQRLYSEYAVLHDIFGRAHKKVFQQLRLLRHA